MPEYGAETKNFKNDNSPNGSSGNGEEIPVTTYGQHGEQMQHKAVTAEEVKPVKSKRVRYTDDTDDDDDE